MLIDSLHTEDSVSTDVCIIGSGISAGTLAIKLEDSDLDFIIVEAGGKDTDSGMIEKEHVGKDFGLRTTTRIELGGSSNLWHGVLSPLDEIDFSKREWVPHSGWPISRDRIEPFYREASKLLGVLDYRYFDPSGLDQRLFEELNSLEFDRTFLVNKLFQQPLPPKNFKHDVARLTKKSNRLHCIYNAAALELVVNEGGDSVAYLRYGVKGSSVKVVQAKLFVVCSGALETPRLLLNSRRKNGVSIGNDGGNVGRFLMDHPMGNLCQIAFRYPGKHPMYSDLKYRPKIKIKSGLELSVARQREFGLPNHNFYVRPSFVRGVDDKSEKLKLSLLCVRDGQAGIKDLRDVLSSPNVIRQIMAYKLSLKVTYKLADLFFVTEQIPNPNSTVTLSNIKDEFGYPISRINWQMLKEDTRGMRRWFQLLRERILPSEYYEFTHGQHDFNWEDVCTSAVHHVGTARMASDIKHGVVDHNQKVFGVNNVYVADGSVFTTAGNVNNGLTISALSCRLANHLKHINP